MRYNFSSKTFCTQPFSNIQISVQGLYKICCLANDDADRGHIKDENGNYLHVLDHDIDKVINSITHRDHRLQLSRNEEPDRCINCYDKERSAGGTGSVRISRNKMKQRIIEIVSVDEADRLMKPDGSIDVAPIALDVRFGSLCNAKCIMCSAAHSSLWMEDAIKLYGDRAKVMFKENIEEFGASVRWWETDAWWEKFAKIAPSLRSLYPVGGEPLIVPYHDTMLEKLIDWGYAKNIELEYDTNLTALNPRIINLWKHFKNVVLRVSIDETEDRYYYVRYPSNWNRLLDNVNRIRSEGFSILCFTASTGIPTIYSSTRLQKFSEEYNIEYGHRFLYTPPNMNISILPPKAKEEVINFYRKNISSTGKAGQEIIRHLINNFDNHEPNKIKDLVQYLDKLDQIRSTDWKRTLPDVFDLLSRHCPESFK